MSEKDCRNDCTLPMRFPRRPGTEFFVQSSGGECFCCENGKHISADNRPALPHFNYRLGTYASIREWLLYKINNAPNLVNWTHREADDPAIALLEGAAILGDILTFYQDFYANEAFLRTATQRDSIADLVRLLGYRLSPGLGGNALFAFEIKKDEPVTIPAGFPVKAMLEELEKPAEFETKQEITAYPWLSRFNLFRPLEAQNITTSIDKFYISEPNQFTDFIDIKEGDRLMFGVSDAIGLNQPKQLTNAQIVVVDEVSERHGTKIIKIKGKLKLSASVSSLVAYKLGRTFSHFGHNNPDTIVNPSAAVTSTATVNGTTTTTTSTIPQLPVPFYKSVAAATSDVLIAPNIAQKEFPLDSEIFDLPLDVPVIIQSGFTFTGLAYLIGAQLPITTLVATISATKSMLVKWGALNAKVTLLTIAEAIRDLLPNSSHLYIKDTLFHEVLSPLFTIRAEKNETTAANGNTLNFYGTFAQVQNLENRQILIEKTGKVLTAASVPAAALIPADVPQLYPITMSESVTYADFPNENPANPVYGNLVEADEGKTLPETVLGSGDNTQIFQTFKLPKSPLTYHLNSSSTPPETPELEIYVGGRLWQRVETMFGRGAEETIYIVREDAENNSWVQFGDGKTGAKLPNGVKNITARFRLGTGAFGALKADTKIQPGGKLKNLDKIQMPQVVTGGAQREDGNSAKTAAPGKIQSLGRLVSLRDFEAEAAAISGVVSASAAWQLIENVPSVVITVLMETGRSGEINAVTETLHNYNLERGAANFPVEVILGTRRYVKIFAEFALDASFQTASVLPEIEKAVGVNFGNPADKEDQSGLFSLYRRRFGKGEYARTIEGSIQNVAGVKWARVTAFNVFPPGDDPESISLTSAANSLNNFVSCGNAEILSLYYKHLVLTQVAEEGN